MSMVLMVHFQLQRTHITAIGMGITQNLRTPADSGALMSLKMITVTVYYKPRPRSQESLHLNLYKRKQAICQNQLQTIDPVSDVVNTKFKQLQLAVHINLVTNVVEIPFL